jgi:6-phosphogluconolactonase
MSRSGYALAEDQPARPNLPGQVVVSTTMDELIDHVAANLTIHAENCVRTFGDFHLALSGDRRLAPLYRRLMYDPNCRRLPWRRTHLWLVDECCVPLDDDRCQYRLVSDLIADHADIPREQVHPMHACTEGADLDYERELQETLAWREKGQDRLDYVLLALGGRGEAAGLVPHAAALHERRRLVLLGEASPDDERRVTMTPALISAARFVAVLAIGSDVASVVKRIETGREPLEELPIQAVRPLNGELKWYLDARACGIEGADTDE